MISQRIVLCVMLALSINSGCRTDGKSPLDRPDVDATASDPKLVGGRQAAPTMFPFALIWTTHDTDLRASYCSGAKVGPNLILTAAHCVLSQSPRSGERYLGPWLPIPTLSPGNEILYSFRKNTADGQRFVPLRMKVTAVVLHPKTHACLNNSGQRRDVCEYRTPIPDIALLRVESPPQSSFARAESATVSLDEVTPGTPVTMMGYGSEGIVNPDGSSPLPRLKYGHKVVATRNELLEALRGSEADHDGAPSEDVYFGVVSNPNAADHVNLDSGDSGGPLVKRGTSTIIGVNSDGFCSATEPVCQRTNNSIFARLSNSPTYDTATWLADQMAVATNP